MKKGAGRVHDRHARVHFRRGDIAPLHSYPSAEGQKRALHRPSRFASTARYTLGAAGAAFGLATIAVIGLWIAINAGLGHDAIVRNAERFISDIVPGDVEVSIGDTGLAFDASSILALEASDIQVSPTGRPMDKTTFGTIRLGLNLTHLLAGEIRIGKLQVVDAAIDADRLGIQSAGGPPDLFNAYGLYDPEKMTAFVFDTAAHIVDQLKSAGTKSIVLENIGIETGTRPVRILQATLRHTGTAGTLVDAQLSWDGRPVAIAGEVIEGDKGGIPRLNAKIELTDVSTPQDILPNARIRSLAIVLTGGKPAGAAAGKLHAHIDAEGMRLRLTKDEEIDGRMLVNAQLGGNSGKVEVAAGQIELGHSVFPFSGAIAPQAAPASGGNPTYRWEVVSNGARLMPADTEEASLDLNSRLAGTFDPQTRSLVASDLGVRTDGGEVIGSANVVFAEPSPAAFLALRVPSLPVAHAKQLWPWLAAPRAREWVVENLFDGTVTDSKLELAVGPGRLTDDIPLTGDEISGHFNVSGTRFDIVGDIPPVREADGVIDFAGSDVDISLSRGIAYMRDGRTVAASNGTMIIDHANLPGATGKMKIDIAGDAASILELASRKPIKATEKLGMEADEFSGDVTGTVHADIPLESDDAGEVRDWKVKLDFTDLAIAREFDGQRLSDATGTVDIDPLGARFDAAGKLNGMPAKLHFVQPLTPEGPKKQRDVAIEFDDKARNKMAPGLNAILSGPVTVRFSPSGEAGAYNVEADLEKAEFKLPWIGWKKGGNVPAIARFTMVQVGDETTIDDFEISSKTFSMAGKLKIAGDELAEADLPVIKLNRDDNISVRISRRKNGYDVAIKGKSFDGRSLVRQLRADSEDVLGAAGSAPLTLRAQIDVMTGFYDERLRSVRVEYASNGKDPAKADISAIAASGSAVSITDTGGKNRRLQIQAADAGALLRFLDYYENMSGGEFDLAMTGAGDGKLSGHIDIRNFDLVNEPRLRSIVDSPVPESDGRSLNDTLKSNLDTSRVSFDRGFVQVIKSETSLSLTNGVLRGPMIGTTFQGTVYDKDGNMSLTGTFMPAYGLNRIFGEIPVLGLVLGNGRDRGLIGLTYKLTGDAKDPSVQVNPISVVAPGIFRSIFEFR